MPSSNNDDNFATNSLLTDTPIPMCRRPHSSSSSCRKNAQICDIISLICAKSALAGLAVMLTCILIAVFVLSKHSQRHCTTLLYQRQQKSVETSSEEAELIGSDNTIISKAAEENKNEYPPPGVPVDGDAEQTKGLVIINNNNNTAHDVFRETPSHIIDALKYYYVMNGQPPNLPSRDSYDTLDHFVQAQFLSSNTPPPFLAHERTVHYVFVALSPDVVERCASNDSGVRLNFVQYLGILSAFVNLKAGKVVLHANCSFYGPHVDELRRLVGDSVNVIDKQDERSPFRRFQIQPLPNFSYRMKNGAELYLYHRADYFKIWVTYEYGGLMADFDFLFQPNKIDIWHAVSRYAQCVFGMDESPEDVNRNPWTLGVNLGITFCRPHSEFVEKWFDAYQYDYRRHVWAYNSGMKATMLMQEFPDLSAGALAVDRSMALMSAPDMVAPLPSSELVQKWRASSALHHQSHVRKVVITPLIKNYLFNRHSSVLARSMRQILYGSENICTDVNKFPLLSEEDLL